MSRLLVILAVALAVLAIVLRSREHNPPAVLADPVRTPGVLNRDVTQENIKQTICVPGWTRTVRPAVEYTNALKVKFRK